MSSIATINPATAKVVRTFDALDDAAIEERLALASATAASYRRTTFELRAEWMHAAADILEKDASSIARTMTTEMGKTISSAEAEARKCAAGCRYFADNAAAFLADEPADAGAVGAARAYARYEPLGVVLAVMPWNFPLWQVIRFAAPALMAGNVGLLKHASNVPQTALYLEQLFLQAGFPEGAFQTLLVGSGAVEGILRDERVAAATLTGSEPAGRSVAAIAGDVIKPMVLELGGSDPFIVMPSADVARAAQVATTARCQNNGQSCIAAKRFIIHDGVAEEFEWLFVERMSALKVGDPMLADTEVGPLATEAGLEEVAGQVADAIANGAALLCGGTRLDQPGWYFPPTVISGVTTSMRIYAEEVFGPVATIFRVPDIDAAIDLANDTTFGLGANAWTTEVAEQDRFITDLAAGAVFINGMTTSYPQLPFGGIKASGIGRELSAPGIRAFCNLKTVWVGA